MASINSVPPEVASHIFQACDDFGDIVALASTCKLMSAVWSSESQRGVIWSVGQRSVVGFDIALLAVRATDFVKQAHERGVLSPVIDISSLAGTVSKPGLGELKALLDMQHLVRCIKHLFLLPENTMTSFNRDAFDWELTEASINDQTFPNWHENFNIATYRVFLAGAVLANAYQSPFFLTSGLFRHDFLVEYSSRYKIAREKDVNIDDEFDEPVFSTQEIKSLMEFPVYNFEAYEKMNAAFGPFWDWFVEDCRLKEIAGIGESGRPSRSPGAASPKENGLMPEIARFLSSFALLCDNERNVIFANEHGKYGYTRFSEDLSTKKLAGMVRSTSIVLPGVFQVEEISMPLSLKESDFNIMIVSPTQPISRMPDISTLLCNFQQSSGQPNHRGPYSYCPQPPLQFFEYVLRRDFGLRFSEEVFMEAWNPYTCTYTQFRKDGLIFGNGRLHLTGYLQDEYPLPVLSYARLW